MLGVQERSGNYATKAAAPIALEPEVQTGEAVTSSYWHSWSKAAGMLRESCDRVMNYPIDHIGGVRYGRSSGSEFWPLESPNTTYVNQSEFIKPITVLPYASAFYTGWNNKNTIDSR